MGYGFEDTAKEKNLHKMNNYFDTNAMTEQWELICLRVYSIACSMRIYSFSCFTQGEQSEGGRGRDRHTP